jgi:hypothetical protein
MRASGLALALLLAGCAASSVPTTSTEGTPMTEPSASAAIPLGAAGQTLDPGRYTRDGFEPHLTFAVGDGWTAEQVASGFFDLQQDPGSLDVIAVQFANVVGAASAADGIANIRASLNLVVSEPEAVTIGGLDGQRVIVETTDPPDTQPPIFRQVLTVAAGPLSIASARRLQVNLLDWSGGVLAVLVGGSIAEWDRTLAAADPVIASVRIGD